MTTAQAIVIAACIYAATGLGQFALASIFRWIELRQSREISAADREVLARGNMQGAVTVKVDK